MSSTAAGFLFVASLAIALAVAYRPLGDYMYRVVEGRRHLRVERVAYLTSGHHAHPRRRAGPPGGTGRRGHRQRLRARPADQPRIRALQESRVAGARGIALPVLRRLVAKYTTNRVLGFIGEPAVNVVQLNVALDTLYPHRQG